jgi:hypothetical protein
MPGDLLFGRHLGGDALSDLLQRPAARQKPFTLRGGGTGNADDFVEVRFRLRLKQQWDDDNGERMVFPAPAVSLLWRGKPGFDLGEPSFTNGWMQDGLKFFAGAGILKNNPGEFGPVQFTRRADDFFAKDGLNFDEGRLAGLDKLAGEIIGIHDGHAAFTEKTGGGGFAHAHAAGEAADFHWSTARYGPRMRSR